MEHLPRRTGRASILADDLSREETTSRPLLRRVQDLESPYQSKAIDSWMQDPTEDWDLANRILQDVIDLCKD